MCQCLRGREGRTWGESGSPEAVNGDQGGGGGAHAEHTGGKGGSGAREQRFYGFSRIARTRAAAGVPRRGRTEAGGRREGAGRGLGDAGAELKCPDAWLGPSSPPPRAGNPPGTITSRVLSPSSPRPPPASPIGNHLGRKTGSKEREGPTMVTSSRPGLLCTSRRAASPTAAPPLPQATQAEHTWDREKTGRPRPEGAGRVRRSKTSEGTATDLGFFRPRRRGSPRPAAASPRARDARGGELGQEGGLRLAEAGRSALGRPRPGRGSWDQPWCAAPGRTGLVSWGSCLAEMVPFPGGPLSRDKTNPGPPLPPALRHPTSAVRRCADVSRDTSLSANKCTHAERCVCLCRLVTYLLTLDTTGVHASFLGQPLKEETGHKQRKYME